MAEKSIFPDFRKDQIRIFFAKNHPLTKTERLDSKKLTTKISTIAIFVVNFLPNGLFVAIFVLGKICCYFFFNVTLCCYFCKS